MADRNKDKLTSSHFFQAMDRVHVASLYLQTVFRDDMVLACYPELQAHLDRAVQSLEQLYQDIGQFDQTWEP